MTTLQQTPPRGRARIPRRVRQTTGATAAARRGDARLAWIFVAPSILGFLVFAAYPTLRGMYLSFTDYRVLSPAEWVGFDNYVKLAHDAQFWGSVVTTLYFVVLTVVLTMAVSLATAVVLHRLTASTVLRSVVILPFLISNVVAAVVWSWMLDAQFGIVNLFLERIGIDAVAFLSDRHWVIPALSLITVWKTAGYTTILIFAGLQTIPVQVYEAGKLDGAGELAMFRRITLPLLRPIMAMVLVLTVIGAFQVFDIVAVSTKGGPANASLVLQMLIYDKAFGQFDFGYASAMSMALFAMLLVISFLQMRLLRADESDQG
ncbi:carbohydrate ABC transporter permease [Cellulomonas soli]|uniref:Sugar ABC transporter permease n=1 Tax=Cellulomonas soli TaxID=931535 RepID=A0A512PDJ7_9CELL|nr:sugar ABC transporter permease [Cellulomonas soli]NYI60065.1 multiple sugar transport system permease protein [Cellulomonas soli]GEP69281.1 sugar ABC transporter permease [Cellulomonas soli]